MKDTLVKSAEEGMEKITVPFTPDYVEQIRAIREEFELSDQVIRIGNHIYRLAIDEVDDQAVLIATRIELPKSGHWWVSSEKTTKTPDELKAWWLEELEKRGIPLHDPNRTIKNNDSPYQIWELPDER